MSGLSSLMILPKYIGYLVVFSVLADFQRDPKYMDWRWWVIISVSIFNLIMIIWNRYKDGLNGRVIADLVWILIYITIIYAYVIKFASKDEVKERLRKELGGFFEKVYKFINIIIGIVIALCVIIIVLFICQFIPVVNAFAIPAVRVLSFIL